MIDLNEDFEANLAVLENAETSNTHAFTAMMEGMNALMEMEPNTSSLHALLRFYTRHLELSMHNNKLYNALCQALILSLKETREAVEVLENTIASAVVETSKKGKK